MATLSDYLLGGTSTFPTNDATLPSSSLSFSGGPYYSTSTQPKSDIGTLSYSGGPATSYSPYLSDFPNTLMSYYNTMPLMSGGGPAFTGSTTPATTLPATGAIPDLGSTLGASVYDPALSSGGGPYFPATSPDQGSLGGNLLSNYVPPSTGTPEPVMTDYRPPAAYGPGTGADGVYEPGSGGVARSIIDSLKQTMAIQPGNVGGEVGGAVGAVPAGDTPAGGAVGSYSVGSEVGQPAGGWLQQVNDLIGNWENDYTAYNEAQANRLANQYRVTGDDIVNMMSQAARQRAGTGIMGGTENQSLLANLLSGLRSDVQAQRQGYLGTSWERNSEALRNAVQARAAALEAAQNGLVSTQNNAMNMIANALLAGPGGAASSIDALAALLGQGQQSSSSSSSSGSSSSYQTDPTAKYQIIASLL